MLRSFIYTLLLVLACILASTDVPTEAIGLAQMEIEKQGVDALIVDAENHEFSSVYAVPSFFLLNVPAPQVPSGRVFVVSDTFPISLQKGARPPPGYKTGIMIAPIGFT